MPAEPAYDEFRDQAAEAIAQQRREVEAYQAQAAQLLASSGLEGVRVDALEPD